MESIDQHIKKDLKELEKASLSGEDKKVRHLTDELQSLTEYKAHHPNENADPNSLELYCDANPDQPECLIYDD